MAMPPVLDRISDYVPHHARAHPERDALVLGDARWSYRRLAEDVERYAASLLAAGVAKGDRVALFSTPRPECFIGFLATASIGGIALGLNPKFPIEELRTFVEDAEPKLLVGHARDAEGDHRAALDQLQHEHACLVRTVLLGAPGQPGVARFEDWLAEGVGVGAAALAAARSAVATRDPCLLVYTAGTSENQCFTRSSAWSDSKLPTRASTALRLR